MADVVPIAKTAEVARVAGRGAYDMPWEMRLVLYRGSHYLINDEFCGTDDLRRGAYRPYVYRVPAPLAAEVARHLEHYREVDERHVDGSGRPVDHRDVLTWMMDQFQALGPASGRPWATAT